MKTILMLIRREYWEHRGSFLYIPLMMAILLFFVAVCAALAYVFGFNIVQGAGSIHVDQPIGLVPLVFYALGVPFVIVLWCVMGHYFLGTLFDDRRDKSILFWQSMPISQVKVLLAKLMAGLILAPLCTLFCMIITQLAFLGLGTLLFMKLHLEYWPIFWRPMPMLVTWSGQLLALLQQSIWLFPFAGWFLFCSAFSRRAPLLRAIVPIIIILVIEGFFVPKLYFWHFILSIILHVLSVWTNIMLLLREYLSGQAHAFTNAYAHQWYDPKMLLGLGVGVMFILAAGWLRRRCYDRQ